MVLNVGMHSKCLTKGTKHYYHIKTY